MFRPRLLAATAVIGLLVPAGAAFAAYPWPIKPFHVQHPIRGFFGDPRTVYLDGLLAGGFDGPGSFSFHQGVDIAAPDGTPIYAIANGTAHYLGASTLNLVTRDNVTFQYFHIVSIVGEGQQVRVSKTILGYVQPPFGHVHITEIDGSRVVNPLQPGHLTPYRDRTKPTIRQILVRNGSGIQEAPLGLCGRVELDADAYDTPPVPVPGAFDGLPVAPAYVRWRLSRLGGSTVVPWKTTADFRKTLPPNSAFWAVYAKGTYQNVPRFGAQQYDAMPGRYLFLLAGSFDTASIPNGAYVITVRASDERGNTAIATQRISILNAPGSTCPASSSAPPGSQPPPDEPTP